MVKILEYLANSLYKNHQCKKYCKSTSEFEGSEIISRTYSTAPALRFSIGGCKIKSTNFYSLQFYRKFKINVCKFGGSQNRWVQLHPLHPSKAGAVNASGFKALALKTSRRQKCLKEKIKCPGWFHIVWYRQIFTFLVKNHFWSSSTLFGLSWDPCCQI